MTLLLTLETGNIFDWSLLSISVKSGVLLGDL